MTSRPPTRRRRRLRLFLLRGAMAVGLLAAWELLSGTVIDSFWISSPTEIQAYLRDGFINGPLLKDVQVTGTEALVGFIVGALLGVFFGMVIARSATLGPLLQPFIVALYGIPRIALAPLFIVWFGLGFMSKLMLVSMVVFFLVFFSTFDGVRSVDPNYIRVARVMGASSKQMLRRVVLPATLPWILTGLRLAVPMAMVGAIVGEFIASNRGLGFRIQRESAFFSTEGSMGVVLIIMVLVIAGNALVTGLERRVLRWRPQETDSAVTSL